MRRSQTAIAALFLLPYLLIFVIFRFVPSIGGLAVSFFEWSLGGGADFVGAKNYATLVSDRSFGISVQNTVAFFLLTVPIIVVGSLALALLLNQRLPGRRLARTISIIPYVLIPSIVGIMWNWLYENNFGLINYYLKQLGGSPVFWLTNSNVALVAVSIVVIWTYLGYNLVLFLAGLQGIDPELGEAASVDGATRWQVFWHITLPLLRPVTMMVITLTLVNVVQLFDQIYVMTNGGPGTATLTIVQYMYTSAFTNYDLGYGATIEVVLLVVLVLVIGLQNRIGNRKDRQEVAA